MSFFEVISYGATLLALLLGLSAVVRRANTAAHWTFFAGMILLAVESFAIGQTESSLLPERILFWQRIRLYVLALLPGTWFIFALVYSRGNYREFLRRWLPLMVALVVGPIVLVTAFGGTLITGMRPGEAPYEWHLRLGWAGYTLYLLHLLGCVMVLMNLERTYRASVGTMRWRIKYMVLGLGLLFAARIFTTSQTLLFSAVNLQFIGVNTLALSLGGLLMIRSLLREGMFSQDIYPSQSVLQYSLTGLLAGLYLLIVGVLAKLVAVFGGDLAFPLKAFLVMVALILLAIFLLSDRIRHFTKNFISRHFHRPSYDYRQIWTTFTRKTSSIDSRDKFCRTVVKWVSETFNVLSVTVWLKTENREGLVFGASTSLQDKGLHAELNLEGDSRGLSAALLKKGRPFHVAESDDSWVAMLKKANPNFFEFCTDRVFVPLLSGTHVLGLMAVGDRVGNVSFSLEDMDLLKCVGDQIAANLLNYQLADKLLESRELEAFQLMSAFFVHDLKNTASTLSLMLKNMPAHFEDPEFRKDALRGLDKSVTRINNLIGRLGMLRQELAINVRSNDPIQVLEQALQSLGPLEGVEIVKKLEPLPKVTFDAERIRKVLTNLLVNASEAVHQSAPNPGRITVSTSQQPGWAILEVRDNGCGMSPEYMAGSLFRPFQTTKQKGVGIGLFLSKKVLEAHGGTIHVESQPGHGSTFRLMLPLKEQDPSATKNSREP